MRMGRNPSARQRDQFRLERHRRAQSIRIAGQDAAPHLGGQGRQSRQACDLTAQSCHFLQKRDILGQRLTAESIDDGFEPLHRQPHRHIALARRTQHPLESQQGRQPLRVGSCPLPGNPDHGVHRQLRQLGLQLAQPCQQPQVRLHRRFLRPDGQCPDLLTDLALAQGRQRPDRRLGLVPFPDELGHVALLDRGVVASGEPAGRLLQVQQQGHPLAHRVTDRARPGRGQLRLQRLPAPQQGNHAPTLLQCLIPPSRRPLRGQLGVACQLLHPAIQSLHHLCRIRARQKAPVTPRRLE